MSSAVAALADKQRASGPAVALGTEKAPSLESPPHGV